MWKYLDKEHTKQFILSLNLVTGSKSLEEKLKLLYTISNHPEKYYEKKYILKKDGTKRELLVPSNSLKSIQRNILNHVLKGLKVSTYACAYVPGKSLKDNVYAHVGQKIILKLDIKNFFQSITFDQLYSVLPNTIFPPSVKVLLLKLCTYEDYLPQGAPTSPYLSNLVMKNFDDYIGEYCLKQNIHYTRYSDDLTFSGDFDVKKLKNKVESFLDVMGFSLNDAKTRILRRHQRQIITGVVVNEKINVSKSVRRKIRQEMYYINKFGFDNHNKFTNQNTSYASILGKINYGLFLNSSNKEFKTYQKALKTWYNRDTDVNEVNV